MSASFLVFWDHNAFLFAINAQVSFTIGPINQAATRTGDLAQAAKFLNRLSEGAG